jgi:hypothetical protein
MKAAPVAYDVVSFLPTHTSSTRLFGFGGIRKSKEEVSCTSTSDIVATSI